MQIILFTTFSAQLLSLFIKYSTLLIINHQYNVTFVIAVGRFVATHLRVLRKVRAAQSTIFPNRKLFAKVEQRSRK